MNAAGYSQTPLAKKLGLKDGFIIRLINQPTHYFSLFTYLPDDLNIEDDTAVKKNLIHFFTTSKTELEQQLISLKNELVPNGMIWVSWPKKASKINTDVTEDIIRNHALSIGLVDIKVCAVDETWSGLKLVIPIKDRVK
ncbi:DUF3052 family protein [soil metagenome]